MGRLASSAVGDEGDSMKRAMAAGNRQPCCFQSCGNSFGRVRKDAITGTDPEAMIPSPVSPESGGLPRRAVEAGG
jgi:hypothetical protein